MNFKSDLHEQLQIWVVHNPHDGLTKVKQECVNDVHTHAHIVPITWVSKTSYWWLTTWGGVWTPPPPYPALAQGRGGGGVRTPPPQRVCWQRLGGGGGGVGGSEPPSPLPSWMHAIGNASLRLCFDVS